MSPTTQHTYNAEADIAVLKEQIATLTNRVGSIAEQQASNFGALQARFDTLTPLVQDITRLQERHGDAQRQIDHAFELIRAGDRNSVDLEGKFDAWCVDHDKEHRVVEKRFNTQRGWFVAGGTLTTVVLGMLIWIAQLFIHKIEAVDDLAHQNQINLLQHKLDEANKGKAP